MERTKKSGVVASLESRRLYHNIHQNKQLLVYFCSLITNITNVWGLQAIENSIDKIMLQFSSAAAKIDDR